MANSSSTANQGRSYNAEWEVLDDKEKRYQDGLGDGLETVLGAGAETLAEIVAGLNDNNVHGPRGQRWTEPLLESELERIAR